MTAIAILVADWSLGSCLGVTVDTLSLANQFAQQLGKPQVKWRLYGASAEVPLANGLSVSVNQLAGSARVRADGVIVSGMGLDHPSVKGEKSSIEDRYSDQSLAKRLKQADIQVLAAAAKRHYEAGGLTCASCSGVLVLGEAGILRGRTATTNWRLGRYLAQHYQTARVDLSRMLVEDGKLITGAAAMAQMDLTLKLISIYMGMDVADQTMSGMLIDCRTSQARYMVWNHLKTNDELVTRFENLIESHLEYPIPIAEMATMLNVSEKTLSRRVQVCTGQSPKQFLQTIRMRRIQSLLDATDMPLEAIASKVGFSNSNSLRKLTARLANLSPGAMRRSDLYQGVTEGAD